MINTKQSGIGLVVASVGAALLTSWLETGSMAARDAALPRSGNVAFARPLRPLALPRVGCRRRRVEAPASWRSGTGSSCRQFVASIVAEIAEKPVYFGCTAAALAAWPVLWWQQGWTSTTRLLAYHAALLVLYNGFLVFTYLALFPSEMSVEAHSFFRYNTHLSLVLSLCLALAARDLGVGRWLVGRRAQVAGRLALATTLLAPLGYAYRLRFDLDMPQPLVRSLAANVKPFLEDGDRLALLLPGDNSSVATMICRCSHRDRTAPQRARSAAPQHRRCSDTRARRRGWATASPWYPACPRAGRICRPTRRFCCAARQTGGGCWRLGLIPKQAFERRWQQILSWGPLCRRS